jgi:hypothetical protein
MRFSLRKGKTRDFQASAIEANIIRIAARGIP